MSDVWHGAPVPIEVNLTGMSGERMQPLLRDHVDPAKAQELVAQLDGSAGDYESNIRRIAEVVSLIQTVVGAAVRILA